MSVWDGRLEKADLSKLAAILLETAVDTKADILIRMDPSEEGEPKLVIGWEWPEVEYTEPIQWAIAYEASPQETVYSPVETEQLAQDAAKASPHDTGVAFKYGSGPWHQG